MVIKTNEELYESDLFDDSAGYEDTPEVRVSKGLTERDRRFASLLYQIFNELWGLCIVKGKPGAGKDTFLNWFLLTCKRYFPQKRILRDEKPRRLFGTYAGLFDRGQIHTDLARMREIARGARKEAGGARFDGTYMAALGKAADEWATGDGAKVLLQNSIIGLTEYHKYVYKREAHDPMNKTMGGIHKVARHLNTLVVGNTQLLSDLDKYTSKPFVNWIVDCSRPSIHSTVYSFTVQRVGYDSHRDQFTPLGYPKVLPLVDAGKPRSFLGNGKIVIRKPSYIPETEEELIVLQALKMGIDDYETLVEFLDDEGAMPEAETLSVLKDLCLKLPLKQPKYAIWYPCYYFTFNSKSAPSMTTKVKVEE